MIKSYFSWESVLPSLIIALMYIIYICFIFRSDQETTLLVVFVMGIASVLLVGLAQDLASVYIGIDKVQERRCRPFFFFAWASLRRAPN